MKLHEYQSKLLFSKFEIPVPKGRIASTASDAKQIAEYLAGSVVIKSQVLVGGRGKAGGIRLVKNPKAAEEIAAEIFAMDIKGLPVRKVLVEEAVSIKKEVYLAITNDRQRRMPVLITSSEGGVDIEDVAHRHPEKITKVYINPLIGLRDYQARDAAINADLPREIMRSFIRVAVGLWQVYTQYDAQLVEINPLVITDDQRIIALDGKVIIDENALFRHPELVEFRDLDVENPNEIEARKYGLSYIQMDGEIGCLVNGAGLAMATMDIIQKFGGKPANFLDIGGGASSEKVTAALRIILGDENIRAVLINIFGGITRCDEVARGIRSAFSEVKPTVPIVVRLIGTNADEGMQLLASEQIITAETLSDAAQKAVEAARN